ncbi:MAG: redoxin domain-containing protein [Bacteroidota bacterium]
MQKLAYLFAIGALLGLTLFGYTAQAQQTRTVADFSLLDGNGKPVKLSDLKDSSLVLVIFTSSHCAWATKYEERIVSLHQTYAPKGVAFLAINANDPRMSQRDAVARMRQVTPYPFPYLKDKEQTVAKNFEVTRNPEVVLLKYVNGAFHVLYKGKIDDNPLDAGLVRNTFLVDAMDAALANKKIEESVTEASGCHIRWKPTEKPE